MRSLRKAGFTLAEILVVVVILGVLAGLVVPRYINQSERGRVAEALNILGAIRQAEGAFFAENGVYTDDMTQLGITIPTANRYFNYTIDADTGSATATRNGGTENGREITLDPDGTWGGDYPNRPTN